MPRLLNDKPCEVTFFDRISESKITLSYRLPTTEERIAYTNALFTRRGNKIENNTGAARLRSGSAILLGFRDGAFETDKGPLSSDPRSPHFDPDWKKTVRQYAPDVIEMLATHAFESSLIADMPDFADDDGKETQEDPL